MQIGYTLMTEQSGPVDLVRYAVTAEQAGFAFEVCSDHYFPWLDAQGHAPYAWSVLGAVANATERVELMTCVTCPTFRYHPAVVAQQAATMGLLSDNRFTLGLGSGENLNEHVVGLGWPSIEVRHERLAEALRIINALLDGGYVTRRGQHYQVDSAKLWDLPTQRVPIAVAVSGARSCEAFAPLADHMIAVEPQAELGRMWDAARPGEGSSRRIGQLPICFDADRDAAITRAHEQFRWFAGGWKVNAELPSTAGFAAATQFLRPEDIAKNISCGPDVAAHVAAARPFAEAGFTDLALVQIGGAPQHQEPFLDYAEDELLPALRAEFGVG
ncbi:MAG: TIGR03557 family F420-dependent LLM class oxidoreductase [Actinomycetota bacterium]|nr:TIGR03557 family F420-dependent LLM class oxidoreductase [Actinomycetota bacterium]